MRTTLATYALVGALGLGGAAGAAVLAPAVAHAATETTDAVSDRVTSLKGALAGLVSAGTLTQAQADSVATTLAETMPGRGGPGGHGGRGGGRVDVEAAAEALGLTVEELRTQSEAGKTLAEIAAAQGVEESTLVDALVDAQQERLAEAVADGRLTQEQADARAAQLEERVTAALDEVLLCGRGGPGGRGDRGPAGEAQTSPGTTPEATQSATPEASSSST